MVFISRSLLEVKASNCHHLGNFLKAGWTMIRASGLLFQLTRMKASVMKLNIFENSSSIHVVKEIKGLSCKGLDLSFSRRSSPIRVLF